MRSDIRKGTMSFRDELSGKTAMNALRVVRDRRVAVRLNPIQVSYLTV